MSTHVTGFIPPDERWYQMKGAWDACTAAGVPVPDEVDSFFGGDAPDDAGRDTEIPYREWRGGMSEGVEVVIADLPPEVKIVRFYNSW